MLQECRITPQFSQALYSGGGFGRVYVALGRVPRRTVEHACGALGRAGLKLHVRLRRLASKSREKCGLRIRHDFRNQPGTQFSE